MEPDGAEILWAQSEDKRSLRYTTFVGDGDLSSFGRVAALSPYRSGKPCGKEECVGHIQKRMGTGLREFVKNHKGKKIGGRIGVGGRGGLTKKRINSMQVSYPCKMT